MFTSEWKEPMMMNGLIQRCLWNYKTSKIVLRISSRNPEPVQDYFREFLSNKNKTFHHIHQSMERADNDDDDDEWSYTEVFMELQNF